MWKDEKIDQMQAGVLLQFWRFFPVVHCCRISNIRCGHNRPRGFSNIELSPVDLLGNQSIRARTLQFLQEKEGISARYINQVVFL